MIPRAILKECFVAFCWQIAPVLPVLPVLPTHKSFAVNKIPHDCHIHTVEVAGSNPAVPTNKTLNINSLARRRFVCFGAVRHLHVIDAIGLPRGKLSPVSRWVDATSTAAEDKIARMPCEKLKELEDERDKFAVLRWELVSVVIGWWESPDPSRTERLGNQSDVTKPPLMP